MILRVSQSVCPRIFPFHPSTNPRSCSLHAPLPAQPLLSLSFLALPSQHPPSVSPHRTGLDFFFGSAAADDNSHAFLSLATLGAHHTLGVSRPVLLATAVASISGWTKTWVGHYRPDTLCFFFFLLPVTGRIGTCRLCRWHFLPTYVCTSVIHTKCLSRSAGWEGRGVCVWSEGGALCPSRTVGRKKPPAARRPACFNRRCRRVEGGRGTDFGAGSCCCPLVARVKLFVAHHVPRAGGISWEACVYVSLVVCVCVWRGTKVHGMRWGDSGWRARGGEDGGGDGGEYRHER